MAWLNEMRDNFHSISLHIFESDSCFKKKNITLIHHNILEASKLIFGLEGSRGYAFAVKKETMYFRFVSYITPRVTGYKNGICTNYNRHSTIHHRVPETTCACLAWKPISNSAVCLRYLLEGHCSFWYLGRERTLEVGARLCDINFHVVYRAGTIPQSDGRPTDGRARALSHEHPRIHHQHPKGRIPGKGGWRHRWLTL